MTAAMRPLDQFGKFGGVVALQRDGVDLNGDAGGLGRINALQDLGQVAASGQGPKQRRLEGVERDIDPSHAMARQGLGETRQLGAVGGQGELVQGAGPQVAR